VRPRAPILLLLVSACSPAKPAGPPPVVTITATDFAFGAPDTIVAGLTTLRMVNNGREPHQAVIMGAPGKTFAELEGVAIPKGPEAEWWRQVLELGTAFPGGPGVVIPADSSIVTVDLRAGNYMIVCFIPSPDRTMHVVKGMFRRLVVIPAPSGATAAEPKSDLTVSLSDYAFSESAPLTAGTHTIRVENKGPQLHELTIERLAPGKTLADWRKWMASGMQGEPVTVPVGGYAGPDKGKAGWVTLTFTPGNYLFLCYVPDTKDGAPHFVHGMVKQVTVS